MGDYALAEVLFDPHAHPDILKTTWEDLEKIALIERLPITVLVNGKPAEVLAAVGYPGVVDGYQVNVRVLSDVAKGAASIQL